MIGKSGTGTNKLNSRITIDEFAKKPGSASQTRFAANLQTASCKSAIYEKHSKGSIVIALCTFVAALALGAAAYYAWYLHTRAPSAYLAMAKGQYKVAAEFFSDEASRGNPAAQNSLANLHYLGLGVSQDNETAAQLYFKSASQGHALAQLNLGNLYSQGLGVPNDAMRAFAWYKMSDIHGNPAAEKYLTQIAVEYTLSPLQISTVSSRWPTLKTLVADGLDR